MEYHFCLREWLADKLGCLLGSLADVLWKMSFQGSKAIFVGNEKNLIFKEKIKTEVWENLEFRLLFGTYFSVELGGGIYKTFFEK